MKWGSVKKARQQNKRMKEKGVVSEASVIFEEAQRVIRESSMTRAQKSTAMEAAAQQFLESGMGTLKGIDEKYSEFINTFQTEADIANIDEMTANAMEAIGFSIEDIPTQEYINEVTEGKLSKKVEYMEADERHRKEMEARHHSGSGAIQQIAEMQSASGYTSYWFYESLRRTAMWSYRNKDASPDQLTAFITELEE